MALSYHGYDEPSEYQKCDKCLDTFQIHEHAWTDIKGFTVCDYCIDSFILEMVDREEKSDD